MNRSKIRKPLTILDSGVNSEALFDLNEIGTVPDGVLKNLRTEKITMESCVAALFNIKPQLTVSEIIIALWRKYNLEISRTRVHALLSSLSSKRYVKREGKGIFVKENPVL